MLYEGIGCLFSEWRAGCMANLSTLAALEEAVTERLMQERSEEPDFIPLTADPLVMKLMVEKFNKRYGGTLNGDQRELLQLFAMPADDGSIEALQERFRGIQETAATEIDSYIKRSESPMVQERLRSTLEQLNTESIEVNEGSIVRHMAIAGLLEELRSEEDEEQDNQ